MENIKTIEDCCKMIKTQNRLLAKYIQNDEYLFVTTLNNLADKILELHQKELKENNMITSENMVFIKPFRKEKIIVDKFGLNFMFKSDRTTFYENDNMRFCFDKSVIRVLLFDSNNKELKRGIQDYFYKKQWRKRK